MVFLLLDPMESCPCHTEKIETTMDLLELIKSKEYMILKILLLCDVAKKSLFKIFLLHNIAGTQYNRNDKTFKSH